MIVGLSNPKAMLFQDLHPMTMGTKRVIGVTWGLNNHGFLQKLRLGLACSLSYQDPFEQFWNDMEPQIMLATPGGAELWMWGPRISGFLI